MMYRLKRIFIHNWGMKIIAVIIAAFVWLLVVNIDDPQQSRNFTSNVEVINADVLEEQGKYYTIPEENNTVTFRVTARRSVIEQLSSSDFLATADMNYLEDGNRIPIDITVLNHANSVTISSRLRYLYVHVGNEMSSRFVVSGLTTGTPADGCVVDNITVTPAVITVTGPEEIVSRIDHVEVTCDVEGMNEGFSENVVPVLVDGNGDPVDTTRLTISDPSLTVDVSLTNVKEVPIEVETSGELPSNLELSKIEIIPETIEIKGNRNILNTITAITIPSSVIDLSTITEDLTTTVDIASYLPEGVTLTDPSKTQVTIHVLVSEVNVAVFAMPTNNIVVRNLKENYQLSFMDETVDVEVSALPSVLEGLEADDFTGEIDVSGLNEGVHTVRVDMNEDRRYEVGTVTVKVRIEEKAE